MVLDSLAHPFLPRTLYTLVSQPLCAVVLIPAARCYHSELARLESTAPVSDRAEPGFTSLLQSCGRSGSQLLVSGNLRSGLLSSASDSTTPGSPLLLRATAQPGASSLASDLAYPGLSTPPRSRVHLGFTFPASSASCPGLSLFVPDSTYFDSPASIRSFVRPGPALLASNFAASGSSPFLRGAG